MKAVLQVQGMMCAHCENRVIQACKELDGLNGIHASAAENKVECDYDEAKLTLLNQYHKKKQFTFIDYKKRIVFYISLSLKIIKL